MNLSTSYHPTIDGQAERTIKALKDMLRACVIDFKGNWYLLKLFMIEGVDLLLDGLRLASPYSFVQRISIWL